VFSVNPLSGKVFSPTIRLNQCPQRLSEKKRKESKKEFSNIREQTIQMIKNGLKDRYSPEQIVGRLKREKKKSVSHETIYKMIYKNHKDCGEYQKYAIFTSREKSEEEEKSSECL